MLFGVQAHFSQGWPETSLRKAEKVGASFLRDSYPWSSAERSIGQYDFETAAARKFTAACRSGHRLMLTAVPQNSLYDNGLTIHSTKGRVAFANYISALLSRWNGCVIAVEVGNEINTANAMRFPEGTNPLQAYVALLQTLHDELQSKFPDVKILGGSTNMVGTGFLEGLFSIGMLEWVDGVAVHPYGSHANSFGYEIARLREAMDEHVKGKEIWASEFSHDLNDSRMAAAEQLRAFTLMAANGVEAASWYALIDQRYFPRMGLFAGQRLKPTGETFTAIQDILVPAARPIRVSNRDRLLFAYRFGPDRFVIWGAGQSLSVPDDARLLDATGKPIPHPSQIILTDEPIILIGTRNLEISKPTSIADSLLQFGENPWSYLAQTNDGILHPLPYKADQYTSYFGSRWYKPLRINLASAAPAGNGTKPIRAVIRYTAAADQNVRFSACLFKAAKGDGVDFRLSHGAATISDGNLIDRTEVLQNVIHLRSGDNLDFSVGPNQTFGSDTFSYRIRIFPAGSQETATCPRIRSGG